MGAAAKPRIPTSAISSSSSATDAKLKSRTDFGSFTPVDAPAEGAPRIDVSDDITPGASISFPLNATGISWIDDEGVSTFGIRWGFDVDDIEVPGELVDVTTSIVPPDSPSSGRDSW
ncbi:MAG: hypothetical protein R3E53_08355 [Myxococcota bacterium]